MRVPEGGRLKLRMSKSHELEDIRWKVQYGHWDSGTAKPLKIVKNLSSAESNTCVKGGKKQRTVGRSEDFL